MSEAGEITNLERLNQGIGLDVRPFVALSWLLPQGSGSEELKFEPGLDIFYNITPSLKLTGTLNTDFEETEVDARQINLTRFPFSFRKSGRFSSRMWRYSILPARAESLPEAFPARERTYSLSSVVGSVCWMARKFLSI